MAPLRFVQSVYHDTRIRFVARIGLAFIAGTAFALAAWEPPVPEERANTARDLSAVNAVLSNTEDESPFQLLPASAATVRREPMSAEFDRGTSIGVIPQSNQSAREQTALTDNERFTIDHPHSRGPP